MKPSASKIAIALFSTIALVVGFSVAKYQAEPPRKVVNATVFNQPRALPEFTLVDHLGQSFTTDSLVGKWSIIFFGFSHCPDVCPTTMAMLAKTYALIEQELVESVPSNVSSSNKPQIYMISVDPTRDTVEKLSTYIPFFHPSFIGVTGSEEQIDALTESIGVAQNKIETGDENYNIDHTSALFLINPQGHMIALSSSPHQPEVLANDFLALAAP